MLDINLIRKDPDYVKAQLAKREYEVDFTELLAWDARRRELIAENEAVKAERNRINKEIPRIKKEGGDMAPLMAKMKEMSESVKRMDEEQRDLEEKIETFVAALPNLPAEDVVAGGKENNQVVKVFEMCIRDRWYTAPNFFLRKGELRMRTALRTYAYAYLYCFCNAGCLRLSLIHI